MSYSISDLGLDLNNEAQSILSEIDALIEFCGRKPERVTLLAIQFDRIKYATCIALKKKIHSEAKRLGGGVSDYETALCKSFLMTVITAK